MFELLFAALIVVVAVVYFIRRKEKLRRMALRDRIEDMFSGLE
ncbi:MAG TPA: hypothetical protein VMD02_06825 [Candidatus Omnitrophota bacterium]|nr:hypothetical protein [Candidatus Omnitrophota bacterium]